MENGASCCCWRGRRESLLLVFHLLGPLCLVSFHPGTVFQHWWGCSLLPACKALHPEMPRACRGKGGNGHICTLATFPCSWGWDLHPQGWDLHPQGWICTPAPPLLPRILSASPGPSATGAYGSFPPNAPDPEDVINTGDSAHRF